MRGLGLLQLVRGQLAKPAQINQKPDHHADARRAEPVMPAPFLAQRPADQRRQKRSHIDADIENGVGAVAA